MAETTRARLIALHKANPDWTGAVLARALGVSRERVRVLADEEELALPQGPFTPRAADDRLSEHAPAMLEALKAISSAYASDGNTKRQKAAFAKVRAVLATIEGDKKRA